MGLFQRLGLASAGRREEDRGGAEPAPPPAGPPAAAELVRALSEAVERDTPDLWTRVGELRLTAASQAAAAARPRPDWPPQVPDLFAGAVTPEIEARDLSPERLGSAILHHGSLIVRNLVTPAEAQELRAGIDRALDACEAYEAGSAAATDAAYVPFPLPEGAMIGIGRRFMRSGGAVWATEAPQTLERILHLYRRRGVVDAIAGHLGETPMLSVGKTVLRRAEPRPEGGDFHQDGAFMGVDIRTVNVWLALTDCGMDAPGLEIVPRRLDALAERGTRGAHFDWSVGRDAAEDAAGPAGTVTPRFGVGDALLFDHMMLHATYSTPAMTERRYAVESWFFAPSAYPADQEAIYI